nr:Uncharacterised protein [Salmonella sp. NCTC 7297]
MTTRSAGICEQEIERLKVDHVEGTQPGLCDLINRQIKTNHQPD